MQPLLLVVVLICAGGTEPSACTRATALDVRVLGRTAMPNECAMRGMLAAARDGEPGRDVCVIRCERG